MGTLLGVLLVWCWMSLEGEKESTIKIGPKAKLVIGILEELRGEIRVITFP